MGGWDVELCLWKEEDVCKCTPLLWPLIRWGQLTIHVTNGVQDKGVFVKFLMINFGN